MLSESRPIVSPWANNRLLVESYLKNTRKKSKEKKERKEKEKGRVPKRKIKENK